MNTLPPLLALLLFLPAAACADSIRISEAVVDPQADHSENSGGNGVPYDESPGNGTVSTVDEFVELFNFGTDVVDMTGWYLDFVDSSPARYLFGATSGSVVRLSAGSSLGQLLPGGYLLLGNPPGSMNQDLDIQLFDPSGRLRDVMQVREGGATGAEDEALSLVWHGSFGFSTIRAPISPLGHPAHSGTASSAAPAGGASGAESAAPTPEPASLLLTILGGLSASARAAVRAVRRRRVEGPRPRSSLP